VGAFLLKTRAKEDVTRLLEAHAFLRDIVDIMPESELEYDGDGNKSPCYILANKRRRE